MQARRRSRYAAIFSPDEAADLFRRWKAGEDHLRGRLIEGYMPLAIHYAKQWVDRETALDDKIGYATLGLIRAVDLYDVEKGIPFRAFARYWILLSLRKHLSPRRRLPVVTNFDGEELVPDAGAAEPWLSRRAASALLGLLPERDRVLLSLRFGLFGHEPHSFAAIGAKVGCSTESARQWVGKVVDRAKSVARTHRGAIDVY